MPDSQAGDVHHGYEEERRRAEAVLGDILRLTDRASKIQADYEGGRQYTTSARSSTIGSLREAKDEAKALAKLALEAAQRVQLAGHRKELALGGALSGSGEQPFKDAMDLGNTLQDKANAMRDLVEQALDVLIAQDRIALMEDERTAAQAAKHHLQASFLVTTSSRAAARATRRDFTEVPEEAPLCIVQRRTPRGGGAVASSAVATPAGGRPPIGVRMVGEPTMPAGWSIPGDPTVNWMWAQLTIIGTDNSMFLPIRRSEASEVQEALGKMLGRSHEDFRLFVRDGCYLRKLLATDIVPSKMMVKGITSWERERQAYAHPFAIIGAGHHGLRQALECLKQDVRDFVVFDRLSKVGGEAWQRLANGSSRLQTEFGTYHLPFDDAHPVPSGVPTWPSRDEVLEHFERTAAEYGLLPHVQLETHVSGLKVEKMSRLQMLEQGKGDSDPNAQHYKLSLQTQTAFEGLSSKARAAAAEEAKTKKGGRGSGKSGAAKQPEADLPGEDADASAAGPDTGPEKSDFKASAVMTFPGSLSVPREELFKGEEVFGGVIAYAMNDAFDVEEAQGELIAICGMGSLAVESVRTCLESGARSCYLICRRKNLVMPRVVSWFINQCAVPAAVAEVLAAMVPMYRVANDDPWSYWAVSSDAALIQQRTRLPVSDFLFLAQYYGRVEIVVGEVKRLLHHMVVLEDGRKLEVTALLKAFGFTASLEVESLMHSSKMFGYWPDADFRRWIYCESTGVDAMHMSTTSLSPLALRTVEFPLHFLFFPKPDFKELVDGGNMHWQSADVDNAQPAYVLNARDASYVISLIVTQVPRLQERDCEGTKRRRQRQCHPVEAFVDEAATEWASYCRVLAGTASDQDVPPYPYTVQSVKELAEKSETEGKKRLATGPTTLAEVATEDGPARTWNPHLKMCC